MEDTLQEARNAEEKAKKAITDVREIVHFEVKWIPLVMFQQTIH